MLSYNDMHYLYIIKNEINNKVYVGQSNKETERWRQHKYYAKTPEKTRQYIHRAMFKYGCENFTFNVIAMSKTQEDADETEVQLIKQYNSRNPKLGYNLVRGGNGLGSGDEHPNFGKKQSIEIIEKRANKIRGLKRTEKTKEKIRQSLLGKKHTEDRKKNQSLAHIGISLSEEHKNKLKEVWRPNDGCFKLGNPAPLTAFKKGQKAWNIGLPKEQQPGYGRRPNLGKTKFSNSQIEEMKLMHKKGYSYREISRIFNISHNTVSRLVRNTI